MASSTETTDKAGLMVQRLLAGPTRPGQAFTIPGENYDTLYRMARRIRAFFDHDQADGQPVCLATDNRTVMAAALLASLAGGPTLLLPHALSDAAFAELQALTGFTRAIGTADSRLPADVTRIDVARLEDEVETLSTDAEPAMHHPWIHLFTGGTTAAPRLWSKSPVNLLTEVDYLIERFGIGSGDRILATVPALHIYGLLYSLLVPLAASARVVAEAPSFPEEIKRQMADTAPTIFVSVPIHYRALKDNPPPKGALRLAFSSAGPLSEVDGQAFSRATQTDLVEVYGSTETGGIATRCRAREEDGFSPYDGIGWQVAGNRLEVRSTFLSPELPVRASGWFTVADRVTRRDGGFIVTGRVDQIVKVGGKRVDLHRVRQTIMAIDGVDDALVSATSVDSGREHELVALVAGTVASPVIKAALDKILEPHEKPRRLHRVANLPRTATGKIDRRAIERQITLPDTPKNGSAARGKTGLAGCYPVDPVIHRLTVDSRGLRPTGDNTPQSLVDWLAARVGDPAAATAEATFLRQLGGYRDSLKQFTLVHHEQRGFCRIIHGRQSTSLGFAVDLGTTSVAGYLCDLKTGTVLTADACVNPQRRYGEDVISRISSIDAQAGQLDRLQQLAAESVNLLLTRCLSKVDATAGDIDEVAVCGNTTMQQTFAGLDSHGLGVAPYYPLTLTPPIFDAGELGLAVDASVPVFLMPVISGFIGGDTLAAILADRPHERDEISLIVDIGTNGEVVLGNREGLWTTSCATGPALEGAQISCGVRTVEGAIHRLWPEAGNAGIAYAVLGGPEEQRPLGLCGSGIIDAVAALRHTGAILPNGRLDEGADGVVPDGTKFGRHYIIADAQQSATGSDIALSQKDIRQVQLAKGALYTGIEFLMRKAGIQKIDRTVLTGAFGARFDWKNALAIGMLPPAVARGRVISKDNLAGAGVIMALLNKQKKVDARHLCRRIRYLELASEPEFGMAFAEATGFPDMEASDVR